MSGTLTSSSIGVLMPPLTVFEVRGRPERTPPKITDSFFAQWVVFRVTTDTLRDYLIILNLKDNNLHFPIFNGHPSYSHVRFIIPTFQQTLVPIATKLNE